MDHHTDVFESSGDVRPPSVRACCYTLRAQHIHTYMFYRGGRTYPFRYDALDRTLLAPCFAGGKLLICPHSSLSLLWTSYRLRRPARIHRRRASCIIIALKTHRCGEYVVLLRRHRDK